MKGSSILDSETGPRVHLVHALLGGKLAELGKRVPARRAKPRGRFVPGSPLKLSEPDVPP